MSDLDFETIFAKSTLNEALDETHTDRSKILVACMPISCPVESQI
jgi:hypothetical protein